MQAMGLIETKGLVAFAGCHRRHGKSRERPDCETHRHRWRSGDGDCQRRCGQRAGGRRSRRRWPVKWANW